jgi:4-hydroxy-2-oxoheptanedioate aldolase
MPVNPLRAKLAAGQTVIGPLLQEIPSSPELVEFLVAAGFDYIIIDAEHGGVSTEVCRDLVRAAESMGGCALARVPNADPARILSFLDQGVQGIVLAHCRGVAEAEALVGAETMCFGLIEDPEAVPYIREMLAVDGFDGCFLGAGDMALSLGFEYFGGPTTHPEVQRLIDQVRDETLAAGKLVMAPAGSGEAAHAAIAQGTQLVVVQFGQFFRAACSTYLRESRGTRVAMA